MFLSHFDGKKFVVSPSVPIVATNEKSMNHSIFHLIGVGDDVILIKEDSFREVVNSGAVGVAGQRLNEVFPARPIDTVVYSGEPPTIRAQGKFKVIAS